MSTQSLPPTERLQQLLPQLFEPVETSGERYLECQLTPELTAILPLRWVQQSKVVPATLITPIPLMPPSFLGLLESQNQVIGVVQLSHLFELSQERSSLRQYPLIIIRLDSLSRPPSNDGYISNDGQFVGLAVHKITRLVNYPSGRLQPMNAQADYDIDSSLLKGIIPIADGSERLVLDMVAIANRIQRLRLVNA
ncbi:MAG: chemotaxis protein CheW [Cyanobacteria bacterium P01_H01_bin.15]